jgi:hypothetical protein
LLIKTALQSLLKNSTLKSRLCAKLVLAVWLPPAGNVVRSDTLKVPSLATTINTLPIFLAPADDAIDTVNDTP